MSYLAGLEGELRRRRGEAPKENARRALPKLPRPAPWWRLLRWWWPAGAGPDRLLVARLRRELGREDPGEPWRYRQELAEYLVLSRIPEVSVAEAGELGLSAPSSERDAARDDLG